MNILEFIHFTAVGHLGLLLRKCCCKYSVHAFWQMCKRFPRLCIHFEAGFWGLGYIHCQFYLVMAKKKSKSPEQLYITPNKEFKRNRFVRRWKNKRVSSVSVF